MKYSFFFCVLFFFLSCQSKNRIYSEHQTLSPNYEWLKKDKRSFTVPINDKKQKFNLSLSFRYANGYPYKSALVNLEIKSPSGEINQKNYELIVRKDDGSYIGNAGYDIWDSEHLIEKDIAFTEKGEYTFTLSQVTPDDPLNFAMEIGVILDKAK
jgi:gliding motility-associated lipoprotein GldH